MAADLHPLAHYPALEVEVPRFVPAAGLHRGHGGQAQLCRVSNRLRDEAQRALQVSVHPRRLYAGDAGTGREELRLRLRRHRQAPRGHAESAAMRRRWQWIEQLVVVIVHIEPSRRWQLW